MTAAIAIAGRGIDIEVLREGPQGLGDAATEVGIGLGDTGVPRGRRVDVAL